MASLHVLEHPLIQHKLSLMRNKNTGSKEFRELLEEIAMLMAYEVTRDFPLKEIEVETPICVMKTKVLAGRKVGVVPILRAGLGMVDGILNLIPAARVATSACTATRKRWNPWSITASCPTTCRSVSSSSLTPCSPPAVRPARPLPS